MTHVTLTSDSELTQVHDLLRLPKAILRLIQLSERHEPATLSHIRTRDAPRRRKLISQTTCPKAFEVHSEILWAQKLNQEALRDRRAAPASAGSGVTWASGTWKGDKKRSQQEQDQRECALALRPGLRPQSTKLSRFLPAFSWLLSEAGSGLSHLQTTSKPLPSSVKFQVNDR